MSSKKVAIIGARGIANYGGFETLVSELAPRLSALGYEVACSHRWADEKERRSEIRGSTPLYFPFKFPKSVFLARLFELFYDWYFVLKCSFGLRCDIVYCLGTGAGFALPLGRLTRSKLVVNIDGLEWKRAKFTRGQRGLIRLLFKSCFSFSNIILVDNSRLTEFVPEARRKDAVFIPYGVSIPDCSKVSKLLAESTSSPTPMPAQQGYWLVVARLEPDNSIHTIVRGYSECKSKMPLVVVGSFSSQQYEREVRSHLQDLPKEKQVVFLGSIFDQNRLTMTRCRAFAYLHGHSVGGTNPSLLEAMSVGSPIIAHDNIFNREVCGDSAVFFDDPSGLARQMDSLEADRSMAARLGSGALGIAKARYSWDEVVRSYDQLFSRL